MSKSVKRLVSTELLDLAAKTAEFLMDLPEVRERWLDENRTSRVSEARGGIIHMEGNYDWIVAFFTWYHVKYAPDLPRVS